MSDLINVSEIFGKNVFNDTAMKERLPKSVYKKLKQTIEDGTELDPSIADVVAHAMKDWAIERGATHYSHWFQPLTGVTAEKHDAFISVPDAAGRVIMEFSGKELIKGEPDASSFPSGGLRSTFEARGYTTWDCTSPAFLREDTWGVTLYIPTAFCSYRGEALDKKTPLLRSMQAINEQSLRILRLFGNTTSKRVIPYVGPEQEYFLIDKEKYLQRKDLIYANRTLFGAMPPKGQEMDDHYFGSIRPRVGAFMKEVNEEMWRLGVCAKTQHNEAAPAQHELAPVYTQVNVAVDHNQMMMEALKRIAGHHGLTCLLHEKPFAGINGSGKHNNWSLTTDDGINMMNPGETPHENIQFLLVLACIMKAVDVHADLLRESTAVPGNDQRLGAAEAPPAIISIFLGEQLEDVIDQLCSTGSAAHSKQGGVLKTGVATLPDFAKDATDRNRTSPFAFTGNKFEFRMVGSSDSVSSPNVVLNTIVAEAFKEAADQLEKADDFDMAVHDMIKKLFAEHRRIIFSGNGYSEEWVKEAERRGLPNLRAGIDSVAALITDKAVELFEHFSVYTRAELESRAEIEYESYAKTINIEAKTMIDMAGKQIIPAVVEYTTQLAKSLSAVRDACPEADVSVQKELILETSALLSEMKAALSNLENEAKAATAISNSKERAYYCLEKVTAAMKKLRIPADKLEMIVDKELWPFPSYGDLIFEV
ncbi:glutamine synthetase III [[Clostridium] symbiosum]|uniref:glutamine synthetase III family protein n=1 Tax=Clostridium symbiosum TaxID=1512 RepID=UPI001D071C01|nr:glutamine synthetase III [[Clostridium] symbiosum]MCB6607831.1 glutamine synthetase III [[Clostridium] symbiosum]MCB6930332.1 glutamine synthetase III [[Clostridium] symbiosum]